MQINNFSNIDLNENYFKQFGIDLNLKFSFTWEEERKVKNRLLKRFENILTTTDIGDKCSKINLVDQFIHLIN